MNGGTVFTLVVIGALILLLILMVRKLIFMLRHSRNQFRGAMGKNTAEYEKAEHVINDHTKNGIIPKWAYEEALGILEKYYTKDAAAVTLQQMTLSRGLRRIDFPRNYYLEPGASQERITKLCYDHFKSFDLGDPNHQFSSQENKTYEYLICSWYFADNAVSSLDEARAAVGDTFKKYVIEEVAPKAN